MFNLYRRVISRETRRADLSESEKLATLYHDLFDFPLNLQELIRWRLADNIEGFGIGDQILHKGGYFFVEGKEGIVYKRTLRKHISARKIEIARHAARILSFIPGILMVAITGSLAMENASDESDIDLMIVTKKGLLWTTRFLSYLVIKMFGVDVRAANDKNQKDKLCLNMWLDESDLSWTKNRNIYTAHEIAQIKPILDKNNVYEKLLVANKWILNYWPNSVKIGKWKASATLSLENGKSQRRINPIEGLAFKLQYLYMRNKITREVVTSTRAIFHPHDWSGVVLSRFSS